MIDTSSLAQGTSTASFENASRSKGITDAANIDKTKSQFLQLLITQLKHQDPLSPADTDQMTAQMMSLGQLEQLFDLNQNMSGLLNVQSSSMIATFSSMVGKKALSQGDTMEINDAEKGTFFFSVPSVPKDTKLRVFDQYKNLVRELNVAVTTPGFQEIQFDGFDKNGAPLEKGYYKYTVEPVNDDGEPITASTFSLGTISSIRIEDGKPVFLMGNSDIPIEDIQRVF